MFAADKERAAGQEVRPVSVQLLADLQVVVAAHRLPATQLQANHQPGPEPRDAACAQPAWDVPREVHLLSRHLPGEWPRDATAEGLAEVVGNAILPTTYPV
jgi:hypothetical protein